MWSDWLVFCDYGFSVSALWCPLQHLPSYLEDNYFTILWWCCIIHQHELATGIHVFSSSWTVFPSPSPSYPSRLYQITSFGCPASCIELTLVIYFTYGNVHDSVLFSQIIPPLPSPTEFKSLFFASACPLLPCVFYRCYHLSEFCIYAIYSICLSLSGLLHSV